MPYIIITYSVVCQFFASLMITYAMSFSSYAVLAVGVAACALSIFGLNAAMEQMPVVMAYGVWGVAGAALSAGAGMFLFSNFFALLIGTGIALALGGALSLKIAYAGAQTKTSFVASTSAAEAE